MRIGIVTYDYDPPIGGLGIVAEQTRSALQVLFPADTTVVLSPSEEADDRVSLLASLRWKKSGGCPLFSFCLFFALPSLIRRHRLDLLHVHAGSGGVFLLKKPSCPLVVTAHHTYLQEAEIVFLNRPIKRWWKRVMAGFERRTYDVADAIVCVSHDTADCLVERYGQHSSKITVIENGVGAVPRTCNGVGAVPRNIPDTKKDKSTVLFIGRLEERKGVWVLLRAIEQLKRIHPKVRVQLVGRDLTAGKLSRALEDRGLKDIVTVTGFIDDLLMERELAQATVLVVPSLLEGFGLIAAEAMIAGTCVVASDAAGLRSIIRDGETGLVFRSGDSTGCARAIARILGDRSLRHTLERQAKREGLKRFDCKERAMDLHRVFEAVILSACPTFPN